MKILCTVTEQGFKPFYNSDWGEKSKLKIGEEIWVEVKKARNYEFLKKFFALLNCGLANSKGKYIQTDNIDLYRAYVTMKAGYVDITATSKGTMITPKSIAFEKMDEVEFQKLYNKVVDFVILDIEATREDIEKVLINFF